MEPEIADLKASLLAERMRNMEQLVERLRAHTPLRKGLGGVQAAEMVWTITSPEVFRLLTQDRGWSREQYARWLGETLIRLLLP
jgi:hypothetical protein